ncbi:MAG: radical SAM protein [Candidatus Bathyarchaeota archaeon]|nr:radical SAM protein [Candidatus Bathyarchaeota archaeon]
MGPIRPTAEGGSHSLLIRATRNCPWSLCKFCYGIPYNREKFQLRSVEEIRRDIDAAKSISGCIQSVAKKLGGLDWAARLLDNYSLYDKEFPQLDHDEMKNFQSIITVFNWLYSGGTSVFLQDADTLIMPSKDLLQVLRYLKAKFPTIEKMTSYARSKSIVHKTLEELRQLHQAGLTRLYVGLESGDDEVLEYVKKGVTGEEHITAGKSAKEAGFQLSEFCVAGLGGKSMSEQNARNTARVLNEINPDYARIRRYVPRAGSPLLEEWKNGAFQLLSPHEELREIQMMIKDLDVTSRVCFDHYIDPAYRIGSRLSWVFKQDHDGYKFPEEKAAVLKLAEEGLKIDESLYVRAEELTEGFV